MRSPTTRITLTMLMKAMQTQNWQAALTAIVKKLLVMMNSRLTALDPISKSRRLQKRIVQNSSSSLPINSDSLTMLKLLKAIATKPKQRQKREKIQNWIQTNHNSTILPIKLHQMKDSWSFRKVSTLNMRKRWPSKNFMPQRRILLIRVV
jgi:hypothetical protein